jgi:ribose/xylose/arabinose/galactoside ABC-type transport system permease subunit
MIKYLFTLGVACIALGVVWPWLNRIGLGHLPGDIRIARKGHVFYFPFTSCFLVSAILTILVWIFRR